ncbi:hypothetical protein VNI00_018216 [Paramarasmius palmivorus]|uniref:Uncharacterized protein n=1 Tax=Paramarasmius palmivorus TaxID=297713 RepID=A0AAW0B066_9AGAR
MEGTATVLDAVLDKLHPQVLEDIQALKQCALTARCLLPAAQRILFRKVTLAEYVPPSKQYRVDQFLGLLTHSPHLAKYTTELYLYIQPSESWGDDLSQEPLSSVVPRLQSLEKVEICIYAAGSGNTQALTARQISTLLGGMAIPEIRSFSLRRLHTVDMKEAFRLCRWLAARGGLRCLQLSDIEITSVGPPSETVSSLQAQVAPTVVPIHLRQFVITHLPSGIDTFLQWATSPNSPLRFTELDELTVGHLTEQSSVYLLRILDIAKNTLSYLRFTGETPSLSSFQFNAYRNLRRISCNLDAQIFSDSRAMVNEWCIALKGSGELKLESFDMQINSFFQDNWSLRPDDLAKILLQYPWNKLEDVLVTGGCCAHFVLHIKLSFARIGADIIRECFPLLHASDVCDLVVKNVVMDSAVYSGRVEWEYTSCSGEWKKNLPLP